MPSYQKVAEFNGTLYGAKEQGSVYNSKVRYQPVVREDYDGAGGDGGAESYGGEEYDPRVRDDYYVGSPGGSAAVLHHPQKSMYSPENTTTDIFAGDGDRYIQGVYGGMYSQGHSGGDALGMYGPPPDYEFLTTEPAESQLITEDYTPSGNTGTANAKPSLGGGTNKKYVFRVNPWVLFVLFIIAFVVFDMWSGVVRLTLSKFIFKNATPTWVQSLTAAVVATLVFFGLLYVSDVSLVKFEEL